MRRRWLLSMLLQGLPIMSSATPPPIALSPVALPPPHRAQRVRLVTGPAGISVMFAEPGPAAVPGPAPPLLIESVEPIAAPATVTSHFNVRRLLRGIPEWDVSRGHAGQLRLAVANFGGALHSLSVLAGEAEQPLIPSRSSDDLGDPRFVRGAREAGAVTALVNNREVVLFSAEPGGGYAHARPLLSGDNLDGALLLGAASGWTLLVRRRELGPQQAGRFPGVLEAHPLDPNLQPAGAAFAVFGSERIFNFDADVTPEGIAVLATTAPGFALARLVSGQPPRVDRQQHPTPLGLVSLVTAGAALHVAFLLPDGSILLGLIRP
jgi:hypothetical protein